MAVDTLALERLGAFIFQARMALGLSQADLAERSSLTQAQISYFESGRRRPALDQLLRIAKALDIPIQRLLSGTDQPGEGLADLAIELRQLGVEDLWVKGAAVPGAFRRPEEVISLALSGREPDPRVVEAIPALLAWNEIDPMLLRAYGSATRTASRIAWLADIALAIDRQGGFPGGCRREPLEHFLEGFATAKKDPTSREWDDLGKPTSAPPASPIWRRWHISYDASLDDFEGRARHLDDLRKGKSVIAPSKLNVATHRTTAKARKPRKGDGLGRP